MSLTSQQYTESKFFTRVQLKYDTWNNWEAVKNSFIPLKGEVCLVEVPSGSNSGMQDTPPSVLMKVGNGEFSADGTLTGTKFADLPWLSAKAADVYAWAKVDAAKFTNWLNGTHKLDGSEVTASNPSDCPLTFATDEELAVVSAQVAAVGGRVKVLEDAVGVPANYTGDTAFERIADLEATLGVGGTGSDSISSRVGALETSMGTVLGDKNTAGSIAEAKAQADKGVADAATASAAAATAQSRADSAYALAETKLNATAKAASAADADKLGGQLPAYYAKQSELNTVSQTASAADTLSKENKAAIEAINNTSTGVLAKAKEYTNEELKAYSKTADISATYETKTHAASEIQRVEGLISTEAQNRASAVSEVAGKVTTLIGSDANKSVRTIANEELAAQLLSGEADADFKTLQELAAWLEAHPEDVAAINTDILALVKEVYGASATDASEFTGNSRIDLLETAVSEMDAAYKLADTNLGKRIDALVTGDASVGSQIAAAKTELKRYADQAETDAINAAKGYTDGQIDAVEKAYAAADAELTKAISDAEGRAATDATNKASAAESNAKTYAEQKASAAETAAKGYADSLIATEVSERNAAIATAKGQAVSDAKTYTDGQIDVVEQSISDEVKARGEAVKGVSDALAQEVEDREAAVKEVADDLAELSGEVDGIAARPFVKVTENTKTNYVIFCCGSSTECV